MARTAEHSIKGYLFQFLTCLKEILISQSGTKVTIEGSIEDIDIENGTDTRAVQCKYHERASNFTLARIYKPILQMMDHFCNQSVQSIDVRYHLYCHFPNRSGRLILSKEQICTILQSNSSALLPVIERISKDMNYDQFLSKLTVEFGPTVATLEAEVMDALRSEHLSREDIKSLFYPAALQRIVDLGTRSNVAERSIDRETLISELRTVKKVSLTRWIKELSTRDKIFLRIRQDLRVSLSKNYRRRVFIIDQRGIDDFESNIVRFIDAFAKQYSCKRTHTEPALFVFSGVSDLSEVESRLLDRGTVSCTPMVGSKIVRLDRLFRSPMIEMRKTQVKFEFHVRLAHLNTIPDLSMYIPDELFYINCEATISNVRDADVYQFDIRDLRELEFLLRMRDRHG